MAAGDLWLDGQVYSPRTGLQGQVPTPHWTWRQRRSVKLRLGTAPRGEELRLRGVSWGAKLIS